VVTGLELAELPARLAAASKAADGGGSLCERCLGAISSMRSFWQRWASTRFAPSSAPCRAAPPGSVASRSAPAARAGGPDRSSVPPPDGFSVPQEVLHDTVSRARLLCPRCLLAWLVPALSRWLISAEAGAVRASLVSPCALPPGGLPLLREEARDRDFALSPPAVVDQSERRFAAAAPAGTRPWGSSPTTGPAAFVFGLATVYPPAFLLAHCLRDGFLLEIDSASPPPRQEPLPARHVRPYPMDAVSRQRVWDKLQREMSGGRLQLLRRCPPGVRFALPVWSVPKGVDDVRVVHDGSYPAPHGLNGHISLDAQWHRDYDSLVSLLGAVTRALPGASPAREATRRDLVVLKCDVKSAFRTLPLHPADQRAFVHVVQHPDGKPRFLRDRAVFFGGRSSSDLFLRVSSLLRLLLRAAGVDAIIVYVDDVVLVVRAGLLVPTLMVVASVMAALALPIALDKLEAASAVGVLGLRLDLPAGTVGLPDDKRRGRLLAVRALLGAAASKHTVARAVFHRVVGKLQYAALILPHGRMLMRPLHAVLRRAGPAPQHGVALHRWPDAVDALREWSQVLSGPWPAVRFAKRVAWELAIVSDASSLALGFATARGWGWAPAEAPGTPTEGSGSTHIAMLELAAVTMALEVLGRDADGSILPVFSDNLNVVGWLARLSCSAKLGVRSSALSAVPAALRRIADWARGHDVTLRPFYIPTKDNVLADFISRSPSQPTVAQMAAAGAQFRKALDDALDLDSSLPGEGGRHVVALAHGSRPPLPTLPLRDPATQICKAAIRDSWDWRSLSDACFSWETWRERWTAWWRA